MKNTNDKEIRIAASISQALASGEPVVALESTVIAHGLPIPLNLGAARASEEIIRQEGAEPAIIGIIEGTPTIGLDEEELKLFAQGKAPDGASIEKVGLNNLAGVMLKRGWGATTVAATLRVAALGGLKVFSTGGIGGVHRGAADSFDVSADLTALSTTPLVCVCAGAKAILDLPKTVEKLETLGVPIVGYQTEEFPAFYSRTSGIPVDITVATADETAEVAWRHWQMGSHTAVLVCVPVPEESEIPDTEVDHAIKEALEMATRMAVRGKALTPFLLSQIEKLTEGNSLKANRALLLNNAQVAAHIAASLMQIVKGS